MDSPSASPASPSDSEEGSAAPPASKSKSAKRGASRFSLVWLLLGLAALGGAIFLALEPAQWREARDIWQGWQKNLSLNSPLSLPAQQPKPQETKTPAPATTPTPAPTTATTTTAAPATPKVLSPSFVEMEQRLRPMERHIKQLQANAQQMRQQLDALLQQQGRLESRLGANSPYARQSALALGLLQLSIASNHGAPFETERQTLASLLPEDADITAMQNLARNGVAGEASLLLQIPSVVGDIAAAREQQEGSGLWAWLKSWVGGLVRIRQLDATETQTRAGILARMENAARNGNLANALAAARMLQGSDAALASNWMASARQRLELQKRIEALSQTIAATTSPPIQ